MIPKSRNRIALCAAAFTMLGALSAAEVQAEEERKSVADKDEAKIGIGARLRYIHIPAQAIELFVEQSAGSASHPGVGVEFIREKGDMVFTIGVEYESISPRDGVYIDKGDSIPQDAVDYVEFEDFKWLALDISFIGQQPIFDDIIRLRYGAGIGIGMLMGEMRRTDYVCTSSDVDSCRQDPNAEQIDDPEDLPPVLPLLNVLLGLQFRPFDNVAINFEGGIRTAPFVGTTMAVLF
ncbi:hypothetical protein [Haliangium ochraceum]|uniref:Outer membrane protein beta-barrel domain-containing protein n=1 Tax=Haliangium ochraceum (strain DSM 14365 / JCM 11303 / SMP-2) TaxID=502025 RepID=D0LFM7_HALO1|nr:hypothetical protein [Haliangium ochraceum]ACY12661.1 hypothetical protein Hoch_0019 [Haliangium ochraceum DSM 14365]